MDQKTIASAFVAVAVIASAWLLGNAWTSTHPAMEKINVTGLAQKDFTSDLIVWRGSFARRAMAINEAYPIIKKDADLIRNYLLQRGIATNEIIFDAIEIEKEYRSVKMGDSYERVFDGYRLWQGVRIESKNVDKVEAISREISELLNAGVELNSQSPEFYYTKLSELKIDLLAKAAKDGKERADKLAENVGGKIGDLRRADMGIFQITAQNSNEEYSWGGAFNTSSKNKTASITVKMEFAVR